jgi:glycosyltransferase involved in cell wall biosynthesis
VLKLYCDLSRLDIERPTGAAKFASQVLEGLTATGQVELLPRGELSRADVILNLDGRFRAGRGQRVVTAVLDLGHLYARSAYRAPEWMLQNWRVASAARRSDHLLVPSAAVLAGLEQYLGVGPERATVFPPLPQARFRRPSRAEVDQLKLRLSLPPRYFLFVGARSGRKNLGLLAEARRLASGLEEVELVLAGPGRGGLKGVRDLGYVPAPELPALISGALAWVNPSHYEGSALGALEAMACGTPVIVAATGAQARAVGLSGVVLPPDDAHQWGQALSAVAADRNLRGRLAAAGLRRVEELRASAPPPSVLIEALSPRPARA